MYMWRQVLKNSREIESPQVFSRNWTQILCKNTKNQELLTAESSIYYQRFSFLMMWGEGSPSVRGNVPMNAGAQGG